MTTDRHNIAPYPLRLQAELRGRLEREAKAAGRSLHAEITSRLEQSFETRTPTDTTAIAALAFRIAALDSDIVSFQKLLHETCDFGVRVMERLLEGPASKEELEAWRKAFAYSLDDREFLQRKSEAKDAAFREAQFRLHGLTKTRQFDETHGSGLFQNLAKVALESLPPASEVYQQSEAEKQHEKQIFSSEPLSQEPSVPEPPTRKLRIGRTPRTKK